MRFFVPGEARPKGSRTLGIRKDGRPYSRPAAVGEQEWTDQVAWYARRHAARSPSAPYRVELRFHLPAVARSKHGYPATNDLDKLVRGVLDGLTAATVLTDDRHVVELIAEKLYADSGPPGVEVVVGSALSSKSKGTG